MDSKVYVVKCLLHNTFSPAYSDYSSYDEVTLLVGHPTFHSQEEPVNQEKWLEYLREFIEDSYLNADGILLSSHLFHLVGIQEVDDEVVLSKPMVETYREFYCFHRLVDEETFLSLYYFDDLR